ncbi:MAG: hypothetical protein IAG13_03850, partial [Deltaproteobacteria bacterium]|nr:hypothetical protein [Nannocystaceae bacterium]
MRRASLLVLLALACSTRTATDTTASAALPPIEPPTGTAVSRIEALLYDRIGLDPTTVGSTLVERAVHRRMSALGITSSAGYLAALGVDSQ